MKKGISFFLVFIMLLVTCSPLISNAQTVRTNESQTFLDSDDLAVSGTNSFGNMLSGAINSNELEKDDNGNRIISVEVNDDEITAELQITTDAIMIVGIYDEDCDEMVASGRTHVTPSDTVIQFNLDNGYPPEYFLVRAFLIDEDTNAPLCKCYESNLYTGEIQWLLQQTTDDFYEENVLNFDEDEENNFAVYNDDTTQIEPSDEKTNVVSVADDDSKTYVIENADSSFTSLQQGDIVSYPYGDNNLLIVKVKNITINGTTVTITGDEIELDDVFDYVKIDNTLGVDEKNFDPATCEEGVTYTGMTSDNYGDTGADTKKDLASSGVEGSIEGSSKVNYNILKVGGDNIKLTGGLELSIGVKLKFYISDTYQFLELKQEYEMKLFGKVEGTLKKEIGLGTLPIGPFWGLKLELKPSLVFEAKASIEFNISIKACIGFSVSNTAGLQNISTPPNIKFNTKIKGTVFFGLKVTAALSFLEKVAEAEVSGMLGAEAQAELDGGDYSTLYSDISGATVSDLRDVSVGKAKKGDPDVIHDCNNCIKGEVYGKLSLDAKVSLLNSPKLAFKRNFLTVKIKISDFHYSLDFHEFGWCRCPHRRCKVEILAFGENKKAAANARVELHYIDKDNKIHKCFETTTDSKGRVSLMLSAGKYNIFSSLGESSSSKIVEVLESKQRINMTLKNGVSGVTGVSYTLSDDGVLTVFGKGPIEDEMFKENYDIEEVVIMDGITAIGDSAFECCELSSVSIPDSVTSIGKCAFAHCSGLQSVDIPGSVTSIGASAFFECYSLESILIEDGVKRIEDGTFAYCNSLIDVTLPNSVTFLGDSAFVYCDQLQSVTLSERLLNIGSETFSQCFALEEIKIPGSVKTIGSFAFCECESLADLTICQGVDRIEESAFEGCCLLENVVLPSGITYLGARMFASCSLLESVTIPASVNRIGSLVFEDTESLSDIYFGGSSNDLRTLANLEMPTYENAPYSFVWGWPESATIHYNTHSTAATAADLEAEFLSDKPALVSTGEGGHIFCSGLIPGSDAVLIVAYDTGDAIDIENDELIYVEQLTTDENGCAEFVAFDKIPEDGYTYVILGQCAHNDSCWKTIEGETNDIISVCNYCGDVLSVIDNSTLGDVDGDGEAEIRDATWIQRYAAWVDIPFPISKITADVDRDDDITVMDATAIQYYLANMKNPHNIGKTL